MHKQLALILVKSKEMDKWVPVQFLIKYGINNVNILELEDKGLLLVKNSESHGRVLKLTLKGYHTFSQFSWEMIQLTFNFFVIQMQRRK
jgi:hypothetical protein